MATASCGYTGRTTADSYSPRPANDNEPVPLEALNLTRDDLAQVDEEHSLSNYFTYEGRDFYYLNSGEASSSMVARVTGSGTIRGT